MPPRAHLAVFRDIFSCDNSEVREEGSSWRPEMLPNLPGCAGLPWARSLPTGSAVPRLRGPAPAKQARPSDVRGGDFLLDACA